MLTETSYPLTMRHFFSSVILNELSVFRDILRILGDPGAVSRGRAKWRDESFQERAPVLENFRRAISPAPD